MNTDNITATTTHPQSPDAASFLAARLLAYHRGEHRQRCWGISSDALTLFAVGVTDEPSLGAYPADRADMNACWRTWLMAPDDLRERMKPVLRKYHAYVAQRSQA